MANAESFIFIVVVKGLVGIHFTSLRFTGFLRNEALFDTIAMLAIDMLAQNVYGNCPYTIHHN